jgi:DNA-binding PadR family transcriptional regulator
MSRIDYLVLASLKKESLSLTEISKKICRMNVEKPPTRIGIHARLKKLNEQGLIVFAWEEGRKSYTITTKGNIGLKSFVNQLMRLSAA